MGQWRMYYMRTYIVCICSWTSRRPKALQDISNMLQIGCMPTEQLERLQLCTNAMGHSRCVLYDSFIDQFHLYKGTAHAAYYLYLAKLWGFSWSESIFTLYHSSYSTPVIDPLHASKGEPIQQSVGIHTRRSISITFLQSVTL